MIPIVCISRDTKTCNSHTVGSRINWLTHIHWCEMAIKQLCVCVCVCMCVQLVAQLIHPAVTRDEVMPFLWQHMRCDVDTVHTAVGCSLDDVLVLVHLLLKHTLEAGGLGGVFAFLPYVYRHKHSLGCKLSDPAAKQRGYNKVDCVNSGN